MRLAQAGVALLRLLADLLPQRAQLRQTLADQLAGGTLLPQDVLAALKDVVVARLVALDLLLERLEGTGGRGRGQRALSFLSLDGKTRRRDEIPTWFFLIRCCTVWRLWPWSVDVAKGILSSTHSYKTRGAQREGDEGEEEEGKERRKKHKEVDKGEEKKQERWRQESNQTERR